MTDQPEADVRNIPLKDILADEQFNCRGHIEPISVADLARDIDDKGLIQPVVVCPMEEGSEKKFRLIAGFRRYMAHRVLKKDSIQAIVRPNAMNEVDARLFNLAENIQRKDLNILQEARAIEKLYKLGLTENNVSSMLGMSRGWVQIRFMLLQLPEDVRYEAAAGVINQKHIRELFSIHRTAGVESVFEAVRRIKDQKIKGLKGDAVTAKKRKPTEKKLRSRAEIFSMQTHVYDTLGNGLITRGLAWAAGEANDIEMFDEIEKYCIDKGISYLRPHKDELVIERA